MSMNPQALCVNPAGDAQTATRPAKRAEFKIGDRVMFNDRDGARISGTVSRVNQKAVTVVPDNRDGHRRPTSGFRRAG